MHRIGRAIALAASVTAGCTQIPHNDVVVFATNTKLALDIASSPTAGNVPTFTLGYKREEGVWMPLVVNGQSSVPLSGAPGCKTKGECASVVSAAQQMFAECMAQPGETGASCLAGALSGIKYVGSEDGRRDTYSVFASFGADLGAAEGGRAALSQFFATGIAAQKLSENKMIIDALSLPDPGLQAVKRANVELDKAAITKSEDNARSILQEIESIETCWKQSPTAYAQAVQATPGPIEAHFVQLFSATGASAPSDLHTRLTTSTPEQRSALLAINAQLCK